jgi:hypothetical protein
MRSAGRRPSRRNAHRHRSIGISTRYLGVDAPHGGAGSSSLPVWLASVWRTSSMAAGRRPYAPRGASVSDHGPAARPLGVGAYIMARQQGMGGNGRGSNEQRLEPRTSDRGRHSRLGLHRRCLAYVSLVAVQSLLMVVFAVGRVTLRPSRNLAVSRPSWLGRCRSAAQCSFTPCTESTSSCSRCWLPAPKRRRGGLHQRLAGGPGPRGGRSPYLPRLDARPSARGTEPSILFRMTLVLLLTTIALNLALITAWAANGELWPSR